MTEEIWKLSLSFPEYEISNKGNVRNKKTKHIIVASPNKKGYYHLGLYANGQRKNVYVHQLVAEAFLLCGSQPNMEVNHKDGDKSNNTVENLEWCTRSENTKHAFKNGLKKPIDHPFSKRVKVVETGKEYESIRKCAVAVNGDRKSIHNCLNGSQRSHKGYHFEFVDGQSTQKGDQKDFLYSYQMDAVKKMRNGSILNGGVGSGKSRTGLFYYFKENGGWIENGEYTPMKNPKDLYIITTAMKRDSLEWEVELTPYLLSKNPEVNYYKNKVVIDSWNNIKKYKDVYGAFFIFDEDRVTGKGTWVKTFLNIARKNNWIILSATPGDTWEQYIPVFIANGFYKNKTEFTREHCVYSRYTKYPKIERYINTGRLIRLRNQILIDMDFSRKTVPHHEDVYVRYDVTKYKEAMRTRWDPFKDEPIQQASGLCYVLRRIVNEDESRQVALMQLAEKHPKMIIFYNFDYELDILKGLYYGPNTRVAEWNGHQHQPVPEGNAWVYLVNYGAGAEGWNCIRTDTVVFYSQTYSYKTLSQAAGRIDRLNTPFRDLYYYHFKSRSGIDLAISKALSEKRQFNENRWVKW